MVEIENEDELEVSPNLKKLLVSEVDFMRDTFSVLLLFLDGAAKTGVKFLEEIENEIQKKE